MIKEYFLSRQWQQTEDGYIFGIYAATYEDGVLRVGRKEDDPTLVLPIIIEEEQYPVGLDLDILLDFLIDAI